MGQETPIQDLATIRRCRGSSLLTNVPCIEGTLLQTCPMVGVLPHEVPRVTIRPICVQV